MRCRLVVFSLLFSSCVTYMPSDGKDEAKHTGTFPDQNKTQKKEDIYRPEAQQKHFKRRKPAVSMLLNKAKEDLASGQLELAQSSLERAYRIDYKDGRILLLMGKVLFAKGQEQQAEQWALRSVDLFLPEEVLLKRKAWEFISQCRIKMGDYEGANHAIEMAKEAEYHR